MRRFLRGTGWAFIGLGGFVLYFLVYQLVGTNATTSREQSSLRDELRREWAAASPPTTRDKTGTPRPVVPRPVSLGKPMGYVEIPRIQLRKILVQGVGRDELRKGPGHVPSTVMPGQPGTLGISGHRTTYGAPFYRLNELGKGDTITLVMREATYTYTVTRSAVVRPTDVQVLDNVRGPDGKLEPTITLTTCHPRYSARQRLVVFGRLSRTEANTGQVAA